MSKVVAFSGGCFSGKTTTINALKDKLEGRGKKVVVLDELIRKYATKPIDEIRKNPSEYLALQCRIIRGKMTQELKAFADTSDTIYLADRSIFDSLFYLTHCVDKSQLSDKDMLKFYDLYNEVASYIENKVNYSYIIMFHPLQNAKTNDAFRPRLLSEASNYEYENIKLYVEGYSCRDIIHYVNLNNANQDVVDYISESL